VKLSQGGLGVRDLPLFNEAISGKLLWKFMNGKKWLPSNIVKVGLVGLPLYRKALMGVVFGDILLKVESNSLLTFLLRLVMVSLRFSHMIGHVRRPH